MTRYLYISTDGGATYSKQTSPGVGGVGSWSSVSVSDDGSTMIATDENGYICKYSWKQKRP